MSLLARYKKPGGFLQLVKLIEGFGKEKKEKFLCLVEQESRNWAGAVEQKVLTVEKIMSWNERALGDIIQKMHKKNVAAMMHGLSEDQREKILSTCSDTDKKNLLESYEDMSPSPGEVASSMVMLIEETREMIVRNYLKLDDLDPNLVIPEDIEEDLASGAAVFTRSRSFAADKVAVQGDRSNLNASSNLAQQSVQNDHSDSAPAHELELLKRKIIDLTKENSLLKKENSAMAAKLEQIKKIA